MLTRKEIEKREDKILASFAMHSKDTRERKYPEKEAENRSVYQRDRDRIIHSTAFRKLEYKTQVFVNHEGDYYRTRLTHTLEVSQIARSIAREMSLNEDLVEAIALAHDIGHPPFGHAGEEALSVLMKDRGGFNHNLQGLRIVDTLEQRYPNFPGLNLTWEVREGISKHTTMFDKSEHMVELDPETSPPLETQVVDIADEIAYDNHDIDDGLTSGLIDEKEMSKLELWKEACVNTKKRSSNKISAFAKQLSCLASADLIEIPYNKLSDRIRRYQMIRYIIDRQIKDLVLNSEKTIKKASIKTVSDVRKCPEKLISFSKNMQDKRTEFRKFLLENLYRNYRVTRMSDKARRFIMELFNVYLEKPEQLPPSDQKKIKRHGIHRSICDYIAGMTDRYALDEYKKLFNPYERV